MRSFGLRIHALRWFVIGGWILALLVASFFAKDIESVLRGGTGTIKGSQSLLVDSILYRDFDNPFTKVAIVTFKSDRLSTDHPDFLNAVARIKKDLVEKDFVRETLSYYDAKDERMRTKDGHALAMLVGMKAKDMREEEKILPRVREAIRETKEVEKSRGIIIETTGRSALTYDFNIISSKDSTKAEGRAIPLTLLVLLLAFGSLVAAGLPLFMGLFSTSVTMGLIVLLGQRIELSTLTQNIATMLGLAVGIDYSLLMVNRFREGLKEGLPVSEAIAETLATSGKAVIYSGLAVLMGLCGLFLTPLFETQSVGVGGTMVVAVSVLAALTLVPAILSVCGTFIDWPPKFSKSIQSEASREAWRKWASFLMDRPVRALLVALVLVGMMVWPAQKFVSGFPSQKWFPLAMESRRGLDVLADMKQGWSIFPVYVIVEKKDEKNLKDPILSPRYLAKLLKVSRYINQDPLVGSVVGPVDIQPGLSPLTYFILYSNLERTLLKYPKVAQLFLSHDRKSTLFQVVMKDSATLEEAKAAVRKWEKLDVGKNLKIKVGGQLVFYNDYDEAMNKSFPRV
ncbi:MAG TPA: MMPL family transporter, partial [Chroococcales cyanobacterium]